VIRPAIAGVLTCDRWQVAYRVQGYAFALTILIVSTHLFWQVLLERLSGSLEVVQKIEALITAAAP
jgi:hypothetical protein